jgi:5,6-dimethylbenzimidazole synthase
MTNAAIPDSAYSQSERDAIYKVIAERRDVRRGFLDQALPDDLLHRLLAAAHSGPSVGLMQPTRFIVIRNRGVREKVRGIFEDANATARAGYEGERRDQYAALKLEGILEAPVNVCVVCDTETARGHGLGRQTMPETAAYSTVCGVQNLWLAARAEGVGVGWVSILDPAKLRAVLGIPEHVLPVAYLCLGYVREFGSQPELERAGWECRVSLDSAICQETYSQPE